MKKLLSLACVAGCTLALGVAARAQAIANAQSVDQGPFTGYQFPKIYISRLPNPQLHIGQTVQVIDAQSPSDCSVGGAKQNAFCVSQSDPVTGLASWVSLSSGAGAFISTAAQPYGQLGVYVGPNEVAPVSGPVSVPYPITSPQVNATFSPEGYGPGTWSGAFSGVISYPACTTISYSGRTYAATETTLGVIPGTGDSAHSGANAYDWLLIRSDGASVTPTSIDCADIALMGAGERATIGSGANSGKSFTLLLGSSQYITNTSLFVFDPAPIFNGTPTPNRVSVSFVGMGSKASSITQGVALPTYATGTVGGFVVPISVPTATIYSPIQPNASMGGSGYAPKTFKVSGISVNAAFLAPYEMDLEGFSVNDFIEDVIGQNGLNGRIRFGVDASHDSWMSSNSMGHIYEYTQGQISGGAFLTASVSAGVPTVGFGVQISSQSPGTGYSGAGTCTVNGGTFTLQATCSATVSSGGLVFAIANPGTYSVVPTSISFAGFTGGSSAAATPAISAGSGYDSNALVVLQEVPGTNGFPCTTMPTATANYPEGAVTPSQSGGSITLGSWTTATGASGCVGNANGYLEAWVSDIPNAVPIGIDFNFVTDSTIQDIFSTSGSASALNFPHGNNKILGAHVQSQGQWGINNGNANSFYGINCGEQRQGCVVSSSPFTLNDVQVGYSIPVNYYEVLRLSGFAATVHAAYGAHVSKVFCSSSGLQTSTVGYHSVVNLSGFNPYTVSVWDGSSTPMDTNPSSIADFGYCGPSASATTLNSMFGPLNVDGSVLVNNFGYLQTTRDTDPSGGVRIGSGSNVNNFLCLSGCRGLFGIDSQNAVMHGGSGKGNRFEVNNSSFDAGLAGIFDPSGNFGVGNTSSTNALLLPFHVTPAGLATAPGYVAGGTRFTASGCTNSLLVGGGTSGQFASGVTGTCTVVITMNGATGLTAPNGWACRAGDITTPADVINQTATTATTCTISGTTASGDTIVFSAMAY